MSGCLTDPIDNVKFSIIEKKYLSSFSTKTYLQTQLNFCKKRKKEKVNVIYTLDAFCNKF